MAPRRAHSNLSSRILLNAGDTSISHRCRLPTPDFGDGVAHGQHQPISSGMEHETDLVRERRLATRTIAGKLCVMLLETGKHNNEL
jgi:hypothetical protein